MKLAALVALSLAASTFAHAGLPAKEGAEISRRANAWFGSSAPSFLPPDECKPRPGDCPAFVAGEYTNSDYRLAAAKACVGNFGSECAKWVSGDAGGFDSRADAARSCRGTRAIDCAVFVGGSSPSRYLRGAAALACKDADLDCVKFVAGDSSSSDFRLAAARACSQPDAKK